MAHTVSKELGIALDTAIKEFKLEGVLDAHKNLDEWKGICEPLNDISTYELAKYIIEGYEYPETLTESVEMFTQWFKNYNNNIPYPTKNSSYRRGRRQTGENSHI